MIFLKKSLNVRKSLNARKSLNVRKSLLSPGAMVSPEKVLRNKIMIISLMKPKTLLKIMLTMIPLVMMTKVNKNSDFLAFSDFLKTITKRKKITNLVIFLG